MDTAKYNDRMYYGFLALFTTVAGTIAYLINC